MNNSEISFTYFFVKSEVASFLEENNASHQSLTVISKNELTITGGIWHQTFKAFIAAPARVKNLLILRALVKYLPFLSRFSLFQRVRINSELNDFIGNFRQSQMNTIEQIVELNTEFIHEEIYSLNVVTSSKPKISLVIPSYNRSDLVINLLQSISRIQRKSEIEIIVVDDGSEDDQFQRLKKIKLLERENAENAPRWQEKQVLAYPSAIPLSNTPTLGEILTEENTETLKSSFNGRRQK